MKVIIEGGFSFSHCMDDFYILLTCNIGLLVLFHFNLQSQELNMKLFINVFDVYINPALKKRFVFFSSYVYLCLYSHTRVQYHMQIICRSI